MRKEYNLKLFKKIDSGVRKFSSALSTLGAAWVIGIMLLIVADVVGRAVFNHPILGVADIARNSVVGIACFMLPWTMAVDKHIRSEVLLDHATDTIKRIMNIFAYTIGLVIFIGIIYSGWEPLLYAIRTHEFEGEGAVKIVTWPVRSLILVAAVVSAYHCLVRLLANISSKLKISDGEVIS
jgi:TRAP-type C4-dicarboxylate transport system permease small subunit